MDLIVHVGYSKTGTTTLQQQFLTTLPGYLGSPTLLGDAGRSGFLKGLAKRTYRGARVDLDAWRTRVLELFGEPAPERIVISDEGLLNWYADGRDRSRMTTPASSRGGGIGSGAHPFAGFLRDHVVPAWQDLGDVRVLLTLRNQSDWLASDYAQHSDRIVGASQGDFERQVRRLVASGDPYLDFDAVVASFRDAVGGDRVLVLLLEDMATDTYWAALSAFVGAPSLAEGTVIERLNQRSTSTGWRVSDYDRAKAPLRRVLRAWRTGTGTRGIPSFGGFRNPARGEWMRVRRRGAEVRITDELRALVTARYRDSNERLGRLLGQDLRRLGY